MKKEERKQKFVDDGRRIADMNVDGMPWYNPAKKDNVITESSQNFTDLTPKEKRAMTLGVLYAALSIGLLFSLGFFLFILFCTKVWFA